MVFEIVKSTKSMHLLSIMVQNSQLSATTSTHLYNEGCLNSHFFGDLILRLQALETVKASVARRLN